MIGIICLLILTPIVSPLVIKLYVSNIPGEMVGSIDGWLGFLGGYTGGFVAFIAAYYIYKNERLEREKTFLQIARNCRIEDDEPPIVLTSKFIDDSEPVLDEIEVISFIEVELELKNVSNNYANDIKLKLTSSKAAKLWFYHPELDEYILYDTVAMLESSSSQALRLRIDNELIGESDRLEFCLISTNLFGQTTKQYIELLLHQEVSRYVFKHRT
ncbi:hypothetical protein [Vibrio sp. V1B]|uniref:hypothetical protein n=1 Tax=Vibrio sp. V1B TaxID=2047825 RepID=UPI001F0AC9EF|nr:hypothetical protein [Vibrio sp. V1B]